MIRTVCLCLALLAFCATGSMAAAEQIPVPGTVTLLDLGSDCIPCDLQDRIVRRVEHSFAGRIAVRYVDVEKFPENKARYQVDVIPLLIFYDKAGKERARHSGYMKEGTMRKLLQQLLDE